MFYLINLVKPNLHRCHNLDVVGYDGKNPVKLTYNYEELDCLLSTENSKYYFQMYF